MKKIFAIAIKEFKSYLSGPGMYVVGGLLMMLMSFSYYMLLSRFAAMSLQAMQFQQSGEGDIHQGVFFGLLSNLNLFFLFFGPVLTMKLLSEERKLRTLDLLLTSPLTSFQIVVGKYLAAVMVVFCLTAITLAYPLVTSFYAEINWPYLLSGYLGVFLVTMMYLAIGLFASSLSESVVVSIIVGIVLSLGTWFVAWGSVVVEDAMWTTILEHMSTPKHFSDLMRGSVESSGIIFLLSMSVLYVFLADRVVESTRWR